MKPDEIIYLERNGFFETEIRVSSALVKSIKEVDTVTVVLNFAFSEVAPSGELRLIAGTGAFDISSTNSVYDDAPDTGVVIIPEAVPTGIAKQENTNSLAVFPNPALTHIYPGKREQATSGTYRIVTLNGSTLREYPAARTQRIDVSDLNQGMYLLMYENESGNREFSRFQVIHY
jgi:hypothetical protein